MNSDYYFQKGLRLIVTGVVVLALIILFCGMVSQGFPLWLALVLLVPAGLGVVGFYFFSLGSSADLSERFFRRFGHSQPRGEEKTTTEGVGSDQRCERSPDAIVPLFLPTRFRTIGFSKMHSPPFTNIPTRIWAMPLTRRTCEFCDDACFIWHV